MGKYIILAILILGITSFSARSAYTAVIVGGAQGAQAAPPESPTQQEIVNIMISRIDSGIIYSKDGRQFDTSGAKVINDCQSRAGITSAELDFSNGELVQVILR